MTHFNGTRKDYAVSLKLAKAGKGRMSREANAAVDKAISEGMTFNDKGSAIVKGEAPKGPVVAKDDAPKADAKEFNQYAPEFYRFDRDQMFWYTDDKGKRREVNGKGVCRGCGFSLIGHTCADPTPTILTAHGWQAVRPVGE